MEVEYSRDGEVALVHLNRPERLNAVTATLTDQLGAALARAAAEGARVVVLAGRGRAFCAGHDLKEPEPVETPVQTRLRLEAIQEVTRADPALPRPGGRGRARLRARRRVRVRARRATWWWRARTPSSASPRSASA